MSNVSQERLDAEENWRQRVQKELDKVYAERDRYKAALENIAEPNVLTELWQSGTFMDVCRIIAKQALEGADTQ